MFRGINPHNLETKEHYKMYKAGKQWIVAGLFVATLGLSGLELPAKADDVKAANKPTQATVTAQTKAPAFQAQSQVISAAQPASSAAKQPVSAAKTAASAAVSGSSQIQSTAKVSSNSLSAKSNQPAQVSQVKSVNATNDSYSQVAQSANAKSIVSASNKAPAALNQSTKRPDTITAQSANSYVAKKTRPTQLSFLVSPESSTTSTNNSTDSTAQVPVNVMDTQTKVYSLDKPSGDVTVITNGTYDSTGFATSPLSVAVYGPYTGQTTNTFGDQNTIDTFDNVKVGRMLVKVTNHQVDGFDVDIPVYSDTAQKLGLQADDVGKFIRFKFTQAKQLIGTPVNRNEPYNQYTGSLVDSNGNVLGPAGETETSQVPVLSTDTPDPDTSLSDADLKKSLDSNIFTDSVAKDFFKAFNLTDLPQDVMTDLNDLVITTEKTYQKPVIEPDGSIKYQNPEDGPVRIVAQAKINPDSLPGSNDNSTATTPYVPVNNYITDPKTGKVSEVLIGYAKQADYEGSGGLKYTLVDSPNDDAKVIGDVTDGKLTPSTVKQVQMTVTFVTTDGSTNVPAKQTPTVNTGTSYDYQNVIVPDMPTGYQVATTGQETAVAVVDDATKDAYVVKIEPISEPVSVTFTANNGNKGITKANAMGTSGTYTTNADYNTTFGKDQLSSVSVPDGYSLDSVTPTNKVGLSGTNNYTATIAPKDETVTLTYENTDGKATTMATGTPTTATAKMDSQFGFGNITTMPTETGYTAESKDKQNPDITVATTGNNYTLKLSPDSEPITVSFVADNKNATIAKLKVTGDVKANYNSTFGIKDVKALPGLPTFAGYDYAAKQNDDITVGTANNNYVVQLVAQDENGTVQVVRSDDPTKTVQQSIPFTAKMDSTFGYADVPVAKINAIPGYTLAAAKQATGKTIGTDATKNIYQVVVAPDAENVTLNLVKTNDVGKVFKSATASANMNSSYGITQAKADLAKLKLEVPTGYSLAADNKQAADETIKTADNAYNVLIVPDVKAVAVSVAATNNAALNIPAFSQTSAVDAIFGYDDVDQTKFTIPAGYQLVAKDKQAKAMTVNNDEAKDTYQVLLAPKTDTKVTVKTALTQSGKQPVTLPADQETTATTDTKYTLADAQSLLGNKLTVNGYHVATAAEKADSDVTVAGNGSSTFTVYLAPDSETLDLKFSALDNSNAADTLNAAKVSVAVPFNSTYVFTGHEKGLPALPTGYVYKSYPSANIENTKSNTMTVEIQKAEQPVTVKVVSTNPEDKLPLQGTHEVTAPVDSKIGVKTAGVVSDLTNSHYHLAPSVKVNQPQTVKPTNDNVYEVVLTPDSFSKTVKLLATVRDYLNHWSTIELSSMVLSGLYGQEISEQTPTVDGYTGETLKATLNDDLPDSMLAYVGQEAHLAVHHYLIDANHHIVRELETDGNLYGTVGGDYYIPNDLIAGYHLVSITGDPIYTAADEATKDNAVNLYYMKNAEKPAQATTTPAKHVAAPVTNKPQTAPVQSVSHKDNTPVATVGTPKHPTVATPAPAKLTTKAAKAPVTPVTNNQQPQVTPVQPVSPQKKSPVTTTVTPKQISAPTVKQAGVKTTKAPANNVVTPQPTVQVASDEPNYVVTGTLNGKPVSYVAKPVVHSVPANVKAQAAGHVETTETPKLSETTQQTTAKQSTPSIVLTSVQKVAKSSNKRVNLTEPQKSVKSNTLRPAKAEVPAAMKHAQALPQTNENQTGIFGMVGAGLMSLLAVFGISKKRRD